MILTYNNHLNNLRSFSSLCSFVSWRLCGKCVTLFMSITILAIESSCDDTAAAVCRDGVILSNFIANQKVHEKYGGVVPELASRAHMQNIVPVVDTALKTANIQLSTIDAIAFTQSPGLIGSLLVGAQFAKSLSLALNK